MKTTIEIGGVEILIEETDGVINVSALKDGETIEEFEIDAEGDESEGDELPEDDENDEEDFEGEDDDMEDDEEGEDDFEDDDMEGEEPEGGESEEDEEPKPETKLESFSSFLKRRK